jgi:peptidoglycan/xylan/chitin deacetylase (PgdA/CDA1 family)
MIRRLALRTITAPPVAAGVAALATVLERLDRTDPSVVPILMYHRIDDPDARPDLAPALLSATPSGFKAQLRHLAREREPIDVGELLELRRRGIAPRPRSVVVTIDDGYADVAEHAWPMLKAIGVPATLFVPTAFPGGGEGFWWDRLWAVLRRVPAGTGIPVPMAGMSSIGAGDGTHRASGDGMSGDGVHDGGGDDGTLAARPADILVTDPPSRVVAHRRLRDALKRLDHAATLSWVADLERRFGVVPAPADVLDWPTLERLAGEGLTLAPHTRTHPLLTQVPVDVVHDEVEGSLADLRAHVPGAPPVLAYPSGAHDAAVRRAVADTSIELALTTDRGRSHVVTADPMAIRRINVAHRTPWPLVRLQLVGVSPAGLA